MSAKPNFDRLARVYKPLEYLTFGKALERCRFHFLPQLGTPKRALVFGDGDGRFMARLMSQYPNLQADVVDISSAMLSQLSRRLPEDARRRIRIYEADARAFEPPGSYDLVATHFFLDCLTEFELKDFFDALSPHLDSGATWVVSEFAYPDSDWHPVFNRIGRVVVGLLYLAFEALTGLAVHQLPDYSGSMQYAGFELREEKSWLRGLLVSQIWEKK